MQELPRRLAPFVPVSPGRGARAAAGLLPPFLPPVLAAAPFICECPAAGMRARVRRRHRALVFAPRHDRFNDFLGTRFVQRIPSGQHRMVRFRRLTLAILARAEYPGRPA